MYLHLFPLGTEQNVEVGMDLNNRDGWMLLKVAFFRKCDSFFRSPNLEKKIFQKTILNLKFKIPAQNSIMLWAGILNFKFKIVFWNVSFFQNLEI